MTLRFCAGKSTSARRTWSSSSSSSCGELDVSESVLALDATTPDRPGGGLPTAEPGLPAGLLEPPPPPTTSDDTRRSASRAPTTVVDSARRRLFCRLSVRRLAAERPPPATHDVGGTRRLLSEFTPVTPAPPLHLLIDKHAFILPVSSDVACINLTQLSSAHQFKNCLKNYVKLFSFQSEHHHHIIVCVLLCVL